MEDQLKKEPAEERKASDDDKVSSDDEPTAVPVRRGLGTEGNRERDLML